MTVLTEGRLQITITGAVSARKFDENTTHRMSHCMKAVDFIIEFEDRFIFIEVKDPLQPGAVCYGDPQEFIANFLSDKLDKDLYYKYRDSFLYECASGRANKPVDYFVLFAWDGLDSAMLHRRTSTLQQKLPLEGPDRQPWPIARGCAVFNLESWNRSFPKYPFSWLL